VLVSAADALRVWELDDIAIGETLDEVRGVRALAAAGVVLAGGAQLPSLTARCSAKEGPTVLRKLASGAGSEPFHFRLWR
jgi:hypothetical protein